MERSGTADSDSTVSTKNITSSVKSAKCYDFCSLSNSIIPTLMPKKYNPLKLRELWSLKKDENENTRLRKKLNQPYPHCNETF